MMLKLETSMQKRELEKNMKEAQKKAEVDKCGTAILTDKLFSFMVSLIYGGIAAVLDNEMAMVTLPAGMAGKDTLVDMFRENAANELAYNIGALIGDIFSIIEGLGKVISGITGAAAGAALAAQSGGATITVSGSGLALAANGMLITISGAGNAAKIMISEATSHGGGKNEGDSDSKDYKAPEGGGGVTDNVKVGDKEVCFGHGGRHLEGTGLSANEVNQAIAKDVVTKNPGTGQFYKGQLDVNGVTIEYTSYGVKDGLINVGTYYPVQ